MTLTIGSVFAGIGGLELGLEWAGLGPVLWQVEIDPFCRAVLAKHWPNVTRFEDVTRPRNYPYVDLICGGFPCQDVSSLGKGRGLGGRRSGLWHHFASIIEKVKPRFVVVENVASGLSRWLRRVRHDLHMLGYRTRAMGVGAEDVGARTYGDASSLLPPEAQRAGASPSSPLERVAYESLLRMAREGKLPTPVRSRARWNKKQGRAWPGLGMVAGTEGRLSPRFVEWMMGFPDGWTQLESESSATP